MKKLIGKKWLLLTAVATFLLSGCASLEQKAQDSVKEVTENVTQTISNDQRIPADFVRHVDGDTTVLKIDGKEQKVRFLLIDTPETVKPKQKFSRSDWKLANAQKSFCLLLQKLRLNMIRAIKQIVTDERWATY